MVLLWIVIGIFAVGILISATCFGRLKNVCRRYGSFPSGANLSGAEFIERAIYILKLKSHYTIFGGEFDDKYLYNKDLIVLSEPTANSSSITAISVAAHELGHAVQKNKNSTLLFVHVFMGAISSIAEFFLFPAILAGIILLFIGTTYTAGITVLYVAIGLWVATIIYRLLSIPVEYGASKIAHKFLTEFEILDKKELKIANKILKAAALTYVGSLFFNILKFFRAIIKSFSRN